MKKLFLISMFVFTQANAQVDAKGEWQFPTSAKSYCQNIEQGLVAMFKSMVENNRKATKPDWTGDKPATFQLAQAQSESIKAYEDSWHKMDCTALLYQRK